MNEKAPKKKPSTIQVNRNRGGGKKRPDLFANLRNQEHPLDSLLPVELEFETLDTQNISTNALKDKNFGHSEDLTLDTQKNSSETPKENNSGHSKNLDLDTHSEFSGQPNEGDLDTFAPKTKTQTPKKDKPLSANAPKENILDTQKKYDYRKYEGNRSTVRVNLHLHKELDQQVREYCVQASPRLELKEFFELAATYFLDTQKKLGLGANAPLNNIISSLSKTKSLIIKLYLAYNPIFNPETKWKTSDDKVGEKYNNVDIRLIEVGIIQTHGELYQQLENGTYRKKDPNKVINAFSYYKQKIETNVEMFQGDEMMIEILHKRHRELWQKWTGKSVDLSFLEKGK